MGMSGFVARSCMKYVKGRLEGYNASVLKLFYDESMGSVNIQYGSMLHSRDDALLNFSVTLLGR